MADQFNNGESNLSIRTKLNANAEEINTNTDDIASLETEKAPIANPTFTGTVSGVTKAMVGLSNVDNTSDANKPVSSATQTALNAKAPTASPTFTGTVSGITKSMVGLGSVDNTADTSKPVSAAQGAAIALKVDKTTTVNSKPLSSNISLDKTDIGLGNVDNTADLNKPISALTANALSTKATPADIEIALVTNKIYFSSETFEGENIPDPTPTDPPVGSEDNPITVKNGGLVVADVIEDGNMNPVTSNAVFDGMAGKVSVPDTGETLDPEILPEFYFDEDDFSGTGTSLDKIRFTRPINTLVESGSINPVSSGAVYTAIDDLREYLLELITSGLTTPEAPTGFVADDEANTADFTYSTGYTDITGYEYQINGGTITSATVKPINIGDVDAPIGGIKIRVKAVPGVSNASPWLTNPTAYTPSGGEYIVERSISLDLQGQFGDTITGDSVTWNTWKALNSEIQVDGAAIISNLVTETNEATTIGVVNVGGWGGSSASTAAATGTPPYPLAAINGGFTLSSDVGLKFTGTNPSKFYQVYVLAADNEANAAVDITAGGNTVNVVSSGNYPPNGSDRYTNLQIAKFFNVVPNGSGEFTISFHKTGSYYQVSIGLILIQESNIAKP